VTAVSRPYIAVCGPGTSERDAEAHAVGRGLAQAGAIVVCGGLGGVMAAAARGAAEAGGTVIGLLPGDDRSGANPYLTVAVPTGLGELRNGLIVRTAEVVIAIRGGWGTLSEVALARKIGRPVVGLGDWDLPEIHLAADPADAVRAALERA